MKNFYRDKGLAIAISLLVISVFVLWIYVFSDDKVIFWATAPVIILITGFAIGKLIQVTRNLYQYYERIDSEIDASEKDSLYNFPLPVAIVDDSRRILWVNDCFTRDFFVLDEDHNNLNDVTDESLERMSVEEGHEIKCNGKYYQVYGRKPHDEEHNELTMLYFEETTQYKELQTEYKMSKPVVMLITIDNYEEMVNMSRESEKAHITVQLEQLFEDYFAESASILRKISSDRFFVIMEERYMSAIIENKVQLLDKAREIVVKDRVTVTLSIGIGRTGKTLVESEKIAKQALDMAQSRGGDQAAIKTDNGFEFYGGVSKGIERQTKVRTRIIANSLLDLINASECVYIMGHKRSDLDAVGSASGLACAVRNLGKDAFVVVNEKTTLAGVLINSFSELETPLFMSPEVADERYTENDLVIIVDTHNPRLVEDEELYTKAGKVVVIDHHRKMVGHIDNAIIFHHEPYASSASEMVTELIQYFGDAGKLSAREAESLLAGIMLDTKNFAMRTGVRTFEAAAYLRKLGADTVTVREMFANTIESYQRKTALVSSASVYRKCAIAVSDIRSEDMMIVAPQAADELLTIMGVDGSFVISYNTEGVVSINARSLGKLNVQVIMEDESLHGGGHLTMAGAQLKEKTLEEARQLLVQAIDNYYDKQQKE